MSKEQVIDELRKKGCRITKQRKLIVDVIVDNDHTTCKDIYYKVARKDSTVGMATVYRMIRLLEEIGVVNRIDMIEVNHDSL